MTRRMLMEVIRDVDTPPYRECLQCGEVYKEPGLWSKPNCPKCGSEEYVHVDKCFFIPAIEAVS